MNISEQELSSLFKTVAAEQQSISYYSSIPAYENEQLVKEILQHVLSQINPKKDQFFK